MLNIEEIEIINRGVAARMEIDILVVRIEIADHIITDIEMRMEQDESLTFYQAYNISFNTYGHKTISQLSNKRIRDIHLTITTKVLRSVTLREATLTLAILLLCFMTGFDSILNLSITYLLVSFTPIFYYIYKRKSGLIKQNNLLADSLLISSILPYSAVTTIFYILNDYCLPGSPLGDAAPFILISLACAYIIKRYYISFQLMNSELVMINQYNTKC